MVRYLIIVVGLCSAGFITLSEGRSESVPPVLVRSSSGDIYDLGRALQSRLAIVVFHRGSWCPYGRHLLKQLREMENTLLERGYFIVAISPDRPERVAAQILELGPGFLLLSDSGLDAASAFSVLAAPDPELRASLQKSGVRLEEFSGKRHGLLPQQSMFFIGADGLIHGRWVVQDAAQRWGSEDILRQAIRVADLFGPESQ